MDNIDKAFEELKEYICDKKCGVSEMIDKIQNMVREREAIVDKLFLDKCIEVNHLESSLKICKEKDLVLYLCNEKECYEGQCKNDECHHTSNIEYAKNFKKAGGLYWEG